MANDEESKKIEDLESQEIKPTALGGMIDVFRANIGDTIAYIIMALGLILCFFEPFIGGIPVGTIMGLYFSQKGFELASQFKDFIVNEGIFRGFIIVSSLTALVISAPGLSLGIVIGVFARPLLGNSISTPHGSSEEKNDAK